MTEAIKSFDLICHNRTFLLEKYLIDGFDLQAIKSELIRS